MNEPKKNGSGRLSDSDLAKVLEMDDRKLCETVRALAQAGGMDAHRAGMLTRNPDAVRRKLSSVRAEELEAMLSRVTPEQLQVIAEQMQKWKTKEGSGGAYGGADTSDGRG